jgi:hypothetical protein
MPWVKALFVISGIYDGLLGMVFLFAPAAVFRIASVVPPNHYGYVQFSALLLIIFGAMFFRIAADPVQWRGLILYGIALKASYCGLVLWYWFHGGIPMLWIPWAWADLGFLLLFFWAWKSVPQRAA